MNQTIFVFIALLAVGLTVGVVWGGRRQQLSSEAGIVGGVAAIALWGLVAINAYNVEVVTNTGRIVTYEYQMLAVLAIAGAVIALVAVIEGVFAQLDQEDY